MVYVDTFLNKTGVFELEWKLKDELMRQILDLTASCSLTQSPDQADIELSGQVLYFDTGPYEDLEDLNRARITAMAYAVDLRGYRLIFRRVIEVDEPFEDDKDSEKAKAEVISGLAAEIVLCLKDEAGLK
jgi:hypothetical protein